MVRRPRSSAVVLAWCWVMLLVSLLAAVALAQGTAGETPQKSAGPLMYVVGILLGIAFRTVGPYLNQLRQDPEHTKFERRYWVPPLAGCVVSFPAVLLGLEHLAPPTGGLADVIAAFTLAYTAQDVSREVQKRATGEGKTGQPGSKAAPAAAGAPGRDG